MRNGTSQSASEPAVQALIQESVISRVNLVRQHRAALICAALPVSAHGKVFQSKVKPQVQPGDCGQQIALPCSACYRLAHLCTTTPTQPPVHLHNIVPCGSLLTTKRVDRLPRNCNKLHHIPQNLVPGLHQVLAYPAERHTITVAAAAPSGSPCQQRRSALHRHELDLTCHVLSPR